MHLTLIANTLTDRRCLLGAYHVLQAFDADVREATKDWASLLVKVHSYLTDISDLECTAAFDPTLASFSDDTMIIEAKRISGLVSDIHKNPKASLLVNGARMLYSLIQMDGLRAEMYINAIKERCSVGDMQSLAVVVGIGKKTPLYIQAENVRLTLKSLGIEIDEILETLLPRFTVTSSN